MMDINDIQKLIDNVVQRPFFCSDTEITTDNGYVITTKEHYEKLKKYWLDIVDVLKEETRIDLEIRWNDKK